MWCKMAILFPAKCFIALLSFIFLHHAEGVSVIPKDSNVTVERFDVFAKIRYRYGQTEILVEIRNHNTIASEEVNVVLELPEEAFITNFTMQIGNQFFNSFLKERALGIQQYSNARKQGLTAGIVSHELKNSFNISLNLQANATLLFQLKYEEEVPLRANGRNSFFEYAVNLVPQKMDVKNYSVTVDIIEFKNISLKPIYLCNPSNRGQCIPVVSIHDDFTIIQDRKDRAKIQWQPYKNPTLMKQISDMKVLGMFKIAYEIVQADENVNEVLVRNGYFIHHFYPRNLPPIPVHIIFVLDISQSMFGQRQAQLTAAMMKILRDLRPNDYYNIITFSSEVEHWCPFKEPQPVGTTYSADDMKYINSSIEFIKSLKTHGNTNIFASLIHALDLTHKATYSHCAKLSTSNRRAEPCIKPSPIIFFLTDGEPTSGFTNQTLILENVKKFNTQSVPIFSLAFGLAADYEFVRTLSSQNKGMARLVYDSADAELQLMDFYTVVGTLVLKNVHFSYTSTSFKIEKLTTSNLDWLASNSDTTVLGQLTEDFQTEHGLDFISEITAKGTNSTFSVKAAVCFCDACTIGNHSAAYLSLTSGNNFSRISLPSEDINMINRVCKEDDQQEDEFLERYLVYKTIKKLIASPVDSHTSEEIVQQALKYKFVTPYTSLVIITPFDDSISANRKEYNTKNKPTVSTDAVAKKVNGEEGKLLFSYDRPTFINNNKKLVNYSTKSTSTTTSSGNETLHETPSLFTYRGRLFAEFDRIKQEALKMKATTTTVPTDPLAAIRWLNKNVSTLNLINNMSKNITNFTIMKDVSKLQKWRDNLSHCKVGIVDGNCKHLADCVQHEFVKDLRLFVKDYFCPIFTGYGKFVGACCPVQINETVSSTNSAQGDMNITQL